MKVIIVGGGTAGWLSALLISKITEHDVYVIDSSSIGIIGAGEGSTGFLRSIVANEFWDFGSNELDFFVKANATPKLGIQHIGWSNKNSSYFAPIDSSIEDNTLGNDLFLMNHIQKNIPFHLSTINGNFIEKNISSFFFDNENILSSQRHAYHFDARLAAEYIESLCSNIKKIDKKIIDIVLDDHGFAKRIIFDDKTFEDADFFIDASGMSRIFSKKMNIKWVSYSDDLLVDSAVPFILKYKDNEKILPVTKAIAHNNGWVWMIPKLYEYGCGYVYSSKHATYHDIVNEIKNSFGNDVEIIKNIQFKSGRMETFWNKNVLSVGLSSAFIEPLEATSIHSTIAQLTVFIFNYFKNMISYKNIEDLSYQYNLYFSKMYDEFKEFIMIHYTGGGLETDFWNDSYEAAIKNKRVSHMIKSSKVKLCTFSDAEEKYGYPGPGLYNWILCGLNYFPTKENKDNVVYNQQINLYKNYINNYIDHHNWIDNTDFINMIRNIKNEKNNF